MCNSISSLSVGQRVRLARVHHPAFEFMIGTIYTVDDFGDRGMVYCKQKLQDKKGHPCITVMALWNESFLEPVPLETCQ